MDGLVSPGDLSDSNGSIHGRSYGKMLGSTCATSGLSEEYNEKLQQKVRTQADELSNMHVKLSAAQSYGELCERRLLELAPDHPLPVTAESLGPPTNDAEEAALKDGQQEKGNRVQNPKDLSGIPAYVVAKNALSRKVERECEDQIFSLKKQVRGLEERNLELSTQLKRARLERDSKEREAKFMGRNLKSLQVSLADTRKALAECRSQQPVRGRDEVKRLRQAEAELRAQTKAAQDTLQEEQLRCKVFEEALELRAKELPGLDGKASLLTELAKLRGEAAAAAKTLASKDAATKRSESDLAVVRARNVVLSQQLTADRAELQRVSTELARLQDHEASQAVAQLSEEKAQLESEKTALLDYIQDSVDRGAEAKKELAEKTGALVGLEEEAAQLRTHCEELKGASQALLGANATIQSKDVALGQLRIVRAELEAALASKEADKEEMQSLQLEILQQLRDAADEKARATSELDGTRKASSAYEERNKELAMTVQRREGEALQSSARLAEYEALEMTFRGEIESLQSTVRELAEKSARVEKVEAHATAMDSELATLRPVRAALEAVERDIHVAESADIRSHSATSVASAVGGCGDLQDLANAKDVSFIGLTAYARAVSVQQKHSAWCSSASLLALSGPLHERIRSLYADLCQRDNEASDARSALEYERRGRSDERASLADQLAACERNRALAEQRELQAESQIRALRQEVHAGLSLQRMVTEIRGVLSSATGTAAGLFDVSSSSTSRQPSAETPAQSEGGLVDLVPPRSLVDVADLPRMVAQQVQAKNEAIGRIQALEARLSAMAAAQAKTNHDLEAASSAQAAAENRHSLTESERRREVSEKRIEADRLRSELEGAAELAEQQNALVLTLEGRLESLSAERQLLAKQHMLLSADVEQHRAELVLVIREAVPVLRACHVVGAPIDAVGGSAVSPGLAISGNAFASDGFSATLPLLDVTQRMSSTVRSLLGAANELAGTKDALRSCQGSADRLQGVVRSLEVANQVSQRENQSLRHQLYGQVTGGASCFDPQQPFTDVEDIDSATIEHSTYNRPAVPATPSEALIEQHRRDQLETQNRYMPTAGIELGHATGEDRNGHSSTDNAERIRKAKASFSTFRR